MRSRGPDAPRLCPYNHTMQRVRFSVRSLPLALALTTIIAYGLLLALHRLLLG